MKTNSIKKLVMTFPMVMTFLIGMSIAVGCEKGKISARSLATFWLSKIRTERGLLQRIANNDKSLVTQEWVHGGEAVESLIGQKESDPKILSNSF